MLNNLESLIEFTRRRAEEMPEWASAILIKQPGLNESQIRSIVSQFPDMPGSYLDIARRIDLNNVRIGYFALAPSSKPSVELMQKLIEANDPKMSPAASLNQRDGVYHVASWEADPIAIAFRESRFHIGQIVLYNCGNPYQPADVIANSFEQFVLLAGNLDHIREKYQDSDKTRSFGEFDDYLRSLPIHGDEAILKSWKEIAAVVLG